MDKQFKTGDVVLFNYNNKNWISKQIENYNLQEYGTSSAIHAGIISEVNYNENKVQIFEILNLNGANFYYYDMNFLTEKIKSNEIHIRRPKENIKNIIENCEKYLYIKYGILDLFAILLYGFFNIKIKSTNMKKVICSELVARVLYDSSKIYIFHIISYI